MFNRKIPLGIQKKEYPTGQNFKKIIALLLCYKRKLLQHIRNKQGFKGPDSINCSNMLFNIGKLKWVEKQVIKSVQQRHSKEEIMTLYNGNSLKSSSKILKLDLFLGQDCILKVKRRIGKCDIDEIQHPTLLLKSCKTTELIIQQCHDKVEHAGNQTNKIFWFLDHKLQFISAINDWEMYQM